MYRHGIKRISLFCLLLLIGLASWFLSHLPAQDVPAPPQPSADEWNPTSIARPQVNPDLDQSPTEDNPIKTNGGTVDGRVFEKETGAGIQNVKIRALLRDDEEIQTFKEVLSGTDGSYEISGLPRGTYLFEIVTPVGFQPPAKSNSRTVSIDEETHLTGCDFALFPEIPLSGIVLDTDDAPVPGAQVHIKSMKFGTPLARRRVLSTDAGGRFSFHNLIPSGTIKIQATTSTASSEMMSLDLLMPGIENLILRVEDGASIEGTVIDPAGQPVGGIKLRIDVLSASGRWFVSRPPVTDPQGRFRMFPLSTGKYKIRLRRDNNIPSAYGGKKEHGTVVRLAAGEHVRGLEIVYDRIYSISGRVVDLRGEPVEGINVDAYAKGLGGSQATTDLSGTFVVEDLPFGSYRVSVHYRDQRITRENVPSDTHDLLLTIKDMTRLSGQVSSATTGEPITSFEVALLREDADLETRAVSKVFDRVADPGGFFSLETSRTGRAMLAVRAEGYYLFSQEIQLPKRSSTLDNIHVLLRASRSLTGIVVNETDVPVSNASILIGEFSASSADQPVTTSDDAGEFTLRSLPEGIFQLSAMAQGYAITTISVNGSETSEHPIRLVLPSGGVLEGVIESNDAYTHASLFVALEYQDGPSVLRETRVSEDGHYRIEALRSGLFLVRIGATIEDGIGYRAILRYAEIENAQTTQLNVSISSGSATVEGRAHAESMDIKKAEVWLRLDTVDGEEEFFTLADEFGTYRISGIPPGSLVGSALVYHTNGDVIGKDSDVLHVQSGDVLLLDFSAL